MTAKQYVNTKHVRERYGVTDMTIWRWQKDPNLHFPAPMVINRRKLWDPADLDAFDARQRGEAA